ncbi:hypothetical protein D3C71_2003000 [compost metagenome]
MPSALMATLPLLPWVTLATGLLAVPVSMSVSLASTSMMTELSSSTEAVSLATTVASLSGLTVTLTVAVAPSALV